MLCYDMREGQSASGVLTRLCFAVQGTVNVREEAHWSPWRSTALALSHT